MSSISDAFPPDDPAARFVVSMSMAKNDIEHALLEADRTGRDDEPEFRYWTRIAASYLFEAAYALSRWRSERDEARQLLGKLPAEASTHLRAVVGLVQRLGPRTLEHSRDRTFHYPHPDPAYTADEDLQTALEELADEEATVHLSADDPPRIRLEFADQVALILTLYEHFARTGEPDASLYAPDIEWRSDAQDPGQEVFHGVEGVKKLIAEVQEAIDDFRTEPFEFLDAGDQVVAGLLHRGRGKGSSAEVEMREWNVFLIRAGRIASVHEYSEREEALVAAGLSE